MLDCSFRTALPFGYLLGAGVFFAVVILGVLLLRRGYKTGNKRWVACGALMVLFMIANLCLGLFTDLTLEMNPSFNDADLVGTWKGSHHELRLNGDGSAQLILSDARPAGRWKRKGDFTISLEVPQSAPSYRVMSSRGRLYLSEDFQDPDCWDGRYLYRKEENDL